MSKLFKAPKAPVYTPMADAVDAPAPTAQDEAAARIAQQKDTKRKYGQSGRAGTVLSSNGGGGLG